MIEKEIQNTLSILKEGGTILYPSDTLWAIGCDATNELAVTKIFNIKKRTESKSLIVLVSDDAMLLRFVKDIPQIAWDIMDLGLERENGEQFKPITIVYDGGRGLAKNALATDGSIGVRMVKRETDDFCHRLIHKSGRPLISTSANISGQPSPGCFGEISPTILKSVDYVVNWRQNENTRAKPSSIIKLKANGEFQIIRE
jgi:L-threonylcarbamoyladenylate synthase